MSLTLSTYITAMAIGTQTIVTGQGGTPPYVYTILPNGAGGQIFAEGVNEARYVAPLTLPTNPALQYVTLQVEDDIGDTATAQILIGDHLLLFCEILQKELNLANGRIYIYNQKINSPTDEKIFIAVKVLKLKIFGNTNRPDTASVGVQSDQSLNVCATLSIDVISRSTEALRRKEEVVMALNSTYSNLQQQRNSFFIGQIPAGGQFVDLSNIDGSAIPYRFNISVNMQYFVKKIKDVNYYDDFGDAEVTTEA